MSMNEPTEDELRAAYEEEIKQIRVEHIVLENVVTLINLGMRRTGLMEGTESERDPGQVRLAVESVRAVLPLVEEIAPEQLPQIRQALSQLQLAYVRIGGAPVPAPGPSAPQPGGSEPGGSEPPESPERPQPASGEPAGSEPPAPEPGQPGPAQSSGRLWIPGQ